MNDLYRIQTQLTFEGRTAGGHLKDAQLAESAAGTWHVWLPKGRIAILTDDGHMVIEDVSGALACMECSDRAAEKLRRLENLAEKRMLADA